MKTKFRFAVPAGLLLLVLLLSYLSGRTLPPSELDELGKASSGVKPIVDLSNPVQDWERDLFQEYRSGNVGSRGLGDKLCSQWGASFGEADVNAWIARMKIDDSYVRFLGDWFYVPGAGSLRAFYRKYGETIILVGVSCYVIYYAYFKPALRSRSKKDIDSCIEFWSGKASIEPFSTETVLEPSSIMILRRIGLKARHYN